MVLGVVLVLLLAGEAPDPPLDRAAKAQAQVLLREGTKLYRRGHYHEALDKFSGAYALYPSPKLHFNVAQANRELGRLVDALLAFDQFLADPADAPPSAVAEARRSVADLHRSLGQIELRCPTANAEVLLDGKPVGRTPLARPIWSTPGKHLLSVRRDGSAAWNETVEVQAGALKTLSASLQPAPLALGSRPGAPEPLALPRPGQPIEESSWSRLTRRWWFWGAVAALAVGAGVVTAVAWTSGSSPSGPRPMTMSATRAGLR